MDKDDGGSLISSSASTLSSSGRSCRYFSPNSCTTLVAISLLSYSGGRVSICCTICFHKLERSSISCTSTSNPRSSFACAFSLSVNSVLSSSSSGIPRNSSSSSICSSSLISSSICTLHFFDGCDVVEWDVEGLSVEMGGGSRTCK